MAGTQAPAPCVIVPVQALASAKSRLAEVLPDDDRAELVLAMVGDVLDAVRAAHDGPLLLVTPDERYEPAAAVARATLLIDAGTGYNEAVRLALASPEVEAAGAAAVVPADHARARAGELRTALAAVATHEVVVVPSLDGGTGLLGLRPPDAIEPAYGPGSAAAHERAARAAGRSLAVLRLASLERDIDTAGDLAAAEPPLGRRTAAFVAARRALLAG